LLQLVGALEDLEDHRQAGHSRLIGHPQL
jgi:hypothetical protein